MQVVRFEQAGKLHPRRERPGHHSRVWYNPDEVLALSKSWRSQRDRSERVDSKIVERNVRGRVAAKVFPLFKQGMTLEQIVVATETDPLLIRQLWEEWQLTFEEGRRLAERKKQREQERDDQRRFERRSDMEEWRKVKLAEIALVKAREEKRFAEEKKIVVEEKKEGSP